MGLSLRACVCVCGGSFLYHVSELVDVMTSMYIFHLGAFIFVSVVIKCHLALFALLATTTTADHFGRVSGPALAVSVCLSVVCVCCCCWCWRWGWYWSVSGRTPHAKIDSSFCL